MSGTVLVTGGSGYIGGEIIRQLLSKGCTVHTTVRDLAREADIRLRLGGTPDTLKFFEAHLMDDAGWAEAMDQCTGVCHVASPIPPITPKHEDELIVPAREGVLRALRMARAAGVKRFVLTSSSAAITYGWPRSNHSFTERDWTNLDGPGVNPYFKSKTIAERAARDWIAAEGGGIEFVSVNPSLVFGPVLGSSFTPSIEIIRRLLTGKVRRCPDIGWGIVDVRDISDLHVRALNAPNVAGERFIGTAPFIKLIEIARVLKAELGDKARKVPTRTIPSWQVRLGALFKPDWQQMVPQLGNVRNMEATHAREVLGWQPRPVRQTLVDTASSLFAHGLVEL